MTGDLTERQYVALRNALGSVELTADEDRYLRWLAGWDQPSTRAFVSIFRKAVRA